MGSVRAVYVLVVILSFVAPQVSRTAIELSRDASASISLAAPSATSHISRAVTKTDKTFSAAGAIHTECVALFPPIGSLDYVSAQTCDAPHLDLEGPPLAPRPPPLA
jgi:spore coat polysaccharide biosynthesis predicted glycosyltransferase SpsG